MTSFGRTAAFSTMFLLLAVFSASEPAWGDQITTFSISAQSQNGATVTGTFSYDFTIGSISSANIFLSDSDFGSCGCVLTDVLGNSIDSLTLMPDPDVQMTFISITPSGYTLCVQSNGASCGFNVSNIGSLGGALFDPLVSATGGVVTPEPGSLLLLLTGLSGVLLFRWRHREKLNRIAA